MADDFYLFANCNFVPGGYVPWQAAYDDLAVHVYNHEPTTKTYYFGIPLEYQDDYDRTTMMFAFEVYGKREDLYQTHFTSPAMGQFLQKIPPTMTTGLDLMHYGYIAGFLDKPGDQQECALMQDTRITAVTPEARQAIATRLKRLGKTIEASDQGVYTWLALYSHDDDVSLRIFIRYEDRQALENYQARDEVLDFWASSKDDVKQMEWRCYVPNSTAEKKKGWLHR